MAELIIKLNGASELEQALRRRSKDAHAQVKRAVVHGMEKFSGHIQKTQMSGRPGLKTRTGALKDSWFIRTMTSTGTLISRLATTSKYAKIHQTGGVIKPKNAKYLTIPLTKEAAKRKARSFSKLVLFKSKKGNLILARLTPKRKSIRPQYVLKKSVNMPKRLHVFEAFKTIGKRMLALELRKAIKFFGKGR